MKQILVVLAALMLWANSLPAAEARAGAKPNFVVIFIDDLGYGDIGPFGATKQKTPNLDRMASEGIKLTSFYAAPVCSVSRAQILTGCYGARVSVPGVYGPGGANGLNPAEHTVAERLKERGYATACVGKWHLGDQPEFLPTKQGFDRYFGIPYSNDMQRNAKDGARVVPLLRDNKVLELLTDEQQSRIVERYTEEAVRFIRDSKDRPFFLYLPHTAVHTPIHPGAAFAGKSANGRFGDWVQEVDWSVGRVLETLRELGLDEKTLVLFTSDNGPWLIKGPDGGSAGPLRGGKGSTWEGGVRVPTVARWPGHIPAGSVCDAVAGTIDLLPTLVALSGGVVPSQPDIDGRDISPLLLGKSKQSQREAHYYFAGYNLQAVRRGPWKLAIATQPQTMGKAASDDAKTNPRLYNLDQEIGEQTNLADKHPEIVARLQALAEKMKTEIGGDSPTARRPAGKVEQPQLLYPGEPTRPRKAGAVAGKTGEASPVELGALKLGGTLADEAAPQVAGRPFTFTCVIESSQSDAVIFAHGGSAVGYAFHLKGGKPVFTVRQGTEEVSVEAGPVSGSTPVTASLLKDGSLKLQVGNQAAATAKGLGLITRQPQEDFCLGHDNRRPAVTCASPNAFTGKITGLRFSSP